MKLLARVDSQKVISLLTDSELVCDYDDCQSSLQSLKMFHPLAELHFRYPKSLLSLQTRFDLIFLAADTDILTQPSRSGPLY